MPATSMVFCDAMLLEGGVSDYGCGPGRPRDRDRRDERLGRESVAAGILDQAETELRDSIDGRAEEADPADRQPVGATSDAVEPKRLRVTIAAEDRDEPGERIELIH